MEPFDAATMFSISTVLLVLSAVDVNADIPDGVVYTDVQKTVFKGDDALLKCDFHGMPLIVHWKKGSDPLSAVNLIRTVECVPRNGSCIEDGTCEMDHHFSLILREVRMEDQGQYICLVANYKGNLIYNVTYLKVIDCHADVPDGVVYTDVQKSVIEGKDAVLKCQFSGTPIAVYWKKGSDPMSAPSLITWVKYLPHAGSCIENGTCEMDHDFSLILREVGMEDQGQYICLVANYRAELSHNVTYVKVIDPDQLGIHTEPYVLGRAGSSVSLACNFTVQVQEVLWERVYWNGGKKVETILKYTSDGHEQPAAGRYSWSENYGLTIRDLHASDEGNFTCLISTTDGIKIENTTVLAVNATQSNTDNISVLAPAIIIPVVLLVLLSFVVYLFIRKVTSPTLNETGMDNNSPKDV